MVELWKEISGYENLYEISNYGRIKSLAKTWRNGQAKRSKPETILKQFNNTHGYPMVTLNKNGNGKNFTVHLLVWDHFGEGCRKGRVIQVDHIDQNKKNARIDNLQLLSNRNNIIKAQKQYRSLPTGVYKYRGKYQVCIQKNGIQKFLGTYSSIEDARKVYLKAEAILYA